MIRDIPSPRKYLNNGVTSFLNVSFNIRNSGHSFSFALVEPLREELLEVVLPHRRRIDLSVRG